VDNKAKRLAGKKKRGRKGEKRKGRTEREERSIMQMRSM